MSPDDRRDTEGHRGTPRDTEGHPTRGCPSPPAARKGCEEGRPDMTGGHGMKKKWNNLALCSFFNVSL